MTKFSFEMTPIFFGKINVIDKINQIADFCASASQNLPLNIQDYIGTPKLSCLGDFDSVLMYWLRMVWADLGVHKSGAIN
jgi:hypothetical protein